MPTARLTIAVDGGADIRRALGNVVTETRRTNAALISSARDASRAQAQIQREELREAQRALRQKLQEQQRVARESTRIERDAAKQKEREANRALAAQTRAEQQAAKAAEREKRKEVTLEQAVQRERTKILERELRERARAIAEFGRQHETGQGAFSRYQNPGDAGGSGGGGGGGGGGQRNYNWGSQFQQLTLNMGRMVHQIASQLHSEIQGARHERATTEHELNNTFGQVTSDPAEMAALRAQVYRFAGNRRQALGMTEEQIQEGMGAAQARFSVLSGGANTIESRRERAGQVMEAMRLGRITGTDTTEAATLYGMLRHNGMAHENAMPLMQQLTAMSFQGSVKLGDVIRGGLPSLMHHIATESATLGAGATSQQRQDVAAQAIRDHFVNLQVEASGGVPVGRGGNALELLSTQLANTPRATMLRNRLYEQYGDRAEFRNMFTSHRARDGSTEYTMNEGLRRNPIGFMRLMGQVTNNDPTALSNLMGAGGNWSDRSGGHRQVLTAPALRMFTSMFTRNAETGQTGVEAASQIAGANLTPEYIRGLTQAREGESQTDLSAEAQQRRDALTNSDNPMVSLSNSLAAFTASSPMLTTALTGVVSALGGSLISRGGTFQLAQTAAGGGGGVAGGAGSTAVGARVAAGGAGALARFASAGAALYSSMALTDAALEQADQHRGLAHRDSAFSNRTWNVASNSDRGEVASAAMLFARDAWAALRRGGHAEDDLSNKQARGEKGTMTAEQLAAATRQAFQNTTIHVTMSTADLLHASAVTSTHSPQAAPGPSGQRR